VVKNLTESVRYKQVEIENQFNEILTATVSHEMRTPLNSILTLLLAIRQFLVGSPRGEELWNILQSSSTILQYLVNDLLDLFQIKKGQFKKNEKEAEIIKEVKAVVDIMKIQCEQKGISLEIAVAPSVPQRLIVDIQRVK
jgi:signal transduction histidine kinase